MAGTQRVLHDGLSWTIFCFSLGHFLLDLVPLFVVVVGWPEFIYLFPISPFSPVVPFIFPSSSSTSLIHLRHT